MSFSNPTPPTIQTKLGRPVRVFTVSSEAEMVALPRARPGDFAIRTDLDPDALFVLYEDGWTVAAGTDVATAVDAAVAALLDGAPDALDTLNELAAALGDDADFAATVASSLAAKVDKSTLDANTVLKADADNTPAALSVPASTVVGRKATGSIAALTGAEVAALVPDGTFVAQTTAQAQNTATTVLKVQHADAAKGPFQLVTGDTLFNSTYDQVMRLGYNTANGGGRVVGTEPSFAFVIEQDYEPGPGTHDLEAYLEYMHSDGVKSHRALFLIVNRTSGDIQSFTLSGNTIQFLNQARTFTYLNTSDGQLNVAGTASAQLNLAGAAGQSAQANLVIGATTAFSLTAGAAYVTTVAINGGNEVARFTYLGGEPCFSVNDASGAGLTKAQFFVDGWNVARPIAIIRALAGQTANILQASSSANASLWAITGTGAIEMLEQADPAAPAADRGRLYMRDNGSGKTQFCVEFATGAVQVLATQP